MTCASWRYAALISTNGVSHINFAQAVILFLTTLSRDRFVLVEVNLGSCLFLRKAATAVELAHLSAPLSRPLASFLRSYEEVLACGIAYVHIGDVRMATTIHCT